MFTIPDGPALARFFGIPRVRGLSVAPDGGGHALEVDAAGPDGRLRSGVLLSDASEPFAGRRVTMLGGGRVAYLARSVSRPGAEALWLRAGGAARELAAPVAAYHFPADGGPLVYATPCRSPAPLAVLYEDGEPVRSLRGRPPRLRLVRGHEVLPAVPDGELTGAFAASSDLVVAERRRAGGVDLVVAEASRGWDWRTLAAHSTGPVLSPDGRRVLCLRGEPWIVDVAGEGRRLAPDLDASVYEAAWSPDGGAVYLTADCDGSRPVYRVDVASGTATRLTDVGAYSNVHPVGDAAYAIRSAIDAPPELLKLGEEPAAPKVPGTLQRVTGPVGGWLCLPPDGPAPLLVWLHGGPHASWAAWSWRWNPWLAVSRGYAVLLPDPAASTGYGRAFLERAKGDWSVAAADVESIVDAVRSRPGIDAARVVAMGASFGGYLVNLLLTRSDRFAAGVSHAGMWDLPAFVGASLVSDSFVAEFGHPLEQNPAYAALNPRGRAAAIRAPLLITHGARDEKVPVTEALTQWSDLRHLGKPAKLLIVPGAGHELVDPATVQLWYRYVFAFLDHALDGKPFRHPG